jgi:hypothetical protein
VRAAARFAFALTAVALAGTAWAAREWYDYYWQAVERDIPDRRWADCANNVKEALRLRSDSSANAQTYGNQFIKYLPHYYLGVCLLEQQDYVGATEAFNLEEQQGAIRKTELMDDLVKRRGTAQAAEAASRARRAGGEVRRLLENARELGKKGAWEESLAELAKAEALARSLDAETLRNVTQEQQRQRTAQADAKDQKDRAQRLEQRRSTSRRAARARSTGAGWPRSASWPRAPAPSAGRSSPRARRSTTADSTSRRSLP